MRTISKSRWHFHGTHKGYEIEIERERPPLFGEQHFYIRVFNGFGHAYDGYSPAGVNTMAEAKREALYGARLKPRPPVHTASGTTAASLSDLLARVEAAEGADRELDAALVKHLDPKAWAKYRNWASMPCGAPEDALEEGAARFADPVTASLDAALALVERVLPEWDISLQRLVGVEPNEWFADLGSAFDPSSAKSPALALLAACLRAKIAQASGGK